MALVGDRNGVRGICTVCKEQAWHESFHECAACRDERLIRRYLRGWTPLTIGKLLAGGLDWRQVAERIGYTQPRRGPEDVAHGAIIAFYAAGLKDTEPPKPDEPMSATRRQSPAWRKWQAARRECVRQWLIGLTT